jgi:hypothetical protein
MIGKKKENHLGASTIIEIYFLDDIQIN